MHKSIRSVVILLFIFLLVGCSTLNQNKSNESINLTESNSSIIKYAQVVDTMDIEGNKAFSKVLSDPKSKSYYYDAYNNMINNSNLNFLEIATQVAEYNNVWTGDFKFVVGSTEENDDYIKDFVNQEVQIKGEKYKLTPLKVLAIGENMEQYLNLSSEMIKGNYFSKEDYLEPIDNKINVVLGSSYQELFEVGDNFSFFYLGENLNATILGFMNEGVEVPASGRLVTVDNYIFIPSFNADWHNSKLERYTQHYSTKVAGVIPYKTSEDFEKAKTEIENIFKVYGLPYTLIETNNTKTK